MSQPERKEFSRSLVRLFATPSLMNGEDVEAYKELHAWVQETVKPREVWDHMMVSDVVNHFWEQQRYRRCTGAIINAGRRAALLKILHDGIGFNATDASNIADNYFGVTRYEEEPGYEVIDSGSAEVPATRHAIIAYLKKHGFCESDIDRVAMEASVDVLTDLESLALKHELRRETILSEFERRRERRSRQQAAAPSRPVDGGDRALETEQFIDASSPPLIEPSP
jgi:hypothetical protein